jgi:hypothetical protein
VEYEEVLAAGLKMALPLQILDLPSLSDVLSLRTWQECLTEGERAQLRRLLPWGAAGGGGGGGEARGAGEAAAAERPGPGSGAESADGGAKEQQQQQQPAEQQQSRQEIRQAHDPEPGRKQPPPEQEPNAPAGAAPTAGGGPAGVLPTEEQPGGPLDQLLGGEANFFFGNPAAALWKDLVAGGRPGAEADRAGAIRGWRGSCSGMRRRGEHL